MINFKINVADIVIAFESDDPGLDYAPSQDERFSSFEYLGEKQPEIKFKIEDMDGSFNFEGEKKLLFSVEGNWNLYKLNDKLLYEYPERRTGNIGRLSLLSQDMKEGVIYHIKKEKKNNPLEAGKQIIAEIKANFFQVFLLDYLIRYKIGILVHGLSLDDNGMKELFMGKSGAGKSTLARIFSQYQGGGTSSYHPVMLLKILIYAYSQKIYSSREIAKAVRENVNFMWLAGGNKPDFRTISDFRKNNGQNGGKSHRIEN